MTGLLSKINISIHSSILVVNIIVNLMQEHVYIAKKGRIIRQSSFIWLFVLLQITANAYAVFLNLIVTRIFAILFINVLLSFLTVPGIVLFAKYYNHSIGKKFIVTYNSLKFIDEKSGKTTEIINSDIDKIYLIKNSKKSKLPWLFHEYFSFVDNKRNKIIITSYFMDISDFWLDSLTRKVNSSKLIAEEKAYPII